jgi:hypothetical protein
VQRDGAILDSLEFDAETREMLGLDDISEILGEIDEEVSSADTATGSGEVRDADDVIEEMDEQRGF